jgi:uncharacterized protein with PQ loop repeat
MNHGLHHVHKRKVSYLAPSENTPFKRWLDKMAYIIAFIGPFALFDQAFQIWKEQSAANVSVIIWIILAFTASFWIMYAVVHKEKAILIAHSIQFIMSLVILFGIFYFTYLF